MATFGSAVRSLRKEAGLTQRQLATLLSVDFTYISKIENGRTDMPPSCMLITHMATVFNMPPDDLLALAGQLDYKALQQVAMEVPEVARLLRRLQTRQFSVDAIRRFLKGA